MVTSKRRSIDGRRIWTCFILSPLVLLITIWIHLILNFLTLTTTEDDSRTIYNAGQLLKGGGRKRVDDNSQFQVIESYYNSSKLLSRNDKVIITSSARGNLGPPSVLNQDPPGKDWIKDRWQAASDMHGTAIKGSHWVMMDFAGLSSTVYITKIILDWETAYAKDYVIEGRKTPPPETYEKGNVDDDGWCILYDGAIDNDNNQHNNYPRRSVEEYGQSPGVKQKLPLHIIHTIEWTVDYDSDKANADKKQKCHMLKYLRIFIRKPGRGWGVSLWQVDVFGALVNSDI